MQKHKNLIILVLICLSSPFAAVILYSVKYHGNGYTNKGTFLKEWPTNQELVKSRWNLISNDPKKYGNKLFQIKRALGKDGLKVNVFTKRINLKQKFDVFISDPKGNIILGYKSQNWQDQVFSDLKHLIKIN